MCLSIKSSSGEAEECLGQKFGRCVALIMRFLIQTVEAVVLNDRSGRSELIHVSCLAQSKHAREHYNKEPFTSLYVS